MGNFGESEGVAGVAVHTPKFTLYLLSIRGVINESPRRDAYVIASNSSINSRCLNERCAVLAVTRRNLRFVNDQQLQLLHEYFKRLYLENSAL